MIQKRASYKTDFDGVVLRHLTMNRINGIPMDFTDYQATIARISTLFLKKNYFACQQLGYELSDLISYGQVWCMNLFNYYFKDAKEKNFDERQKILTYYLKQEFARFAMVLYKKKRNILPDQTLNIDCTEIAVQEEDEEEVEKEQTTNEYLLEKFSNLSHDEMVESIQRILCTKEFSAKTRKFVRSFYEEHQKECKDCPKQTQKVISQEPDPFVKVLDHMKMREALNQANEHSFRGMYSF